MNRSRTPGCCPTLAELPSPPPGKTGWPWTEANPQLPISLPDGQSCPRVSIVTPSYNQGQFVEETIRSVLLQGYPNLEYLVMDGGSTDGSRSTIQAYAPYLTHWCSEKDNGQSAAISKGFSMSSGEILGWVNSDDLLLPNCLQKIGLYFTGHPEIVCVVGGSLTIDHSGGAAHNRLGLPKVVRGERETFKSLLIRDGLSFYQVASFWRREAYVAAGGLDINLAFAMDYDLYLKLAQLGPFGHIDSLLACFRLHPESKTTKLQSVRQRECAELWQRYNRDSIAPAWQMLYRTHLSMANIVRNLPIRVGAAMGIVPLHLPGIVMRRRVDCDGH